MSTGVVIIAAKGADVKLINRLGLHIRDWQYAPEGSDTADRFKFCRNMAEAINAPDDNDGQTRFPVTSFEDNTWEGSSIEEVEQAMCVKSEESIPSLFLLLDDQGVRDQTIIVAERVGVFEDDDDDKWKQLDEFDKCRVPWEHAYGMWANLDIANMDFEDYCCEESETDGGCPSGSQERWWTFNASDFDDGPKNKQKAEAAIAELRGRGLA